MWRASAALPIVLTCEEVRAVFRSLQDARAHCHVFFPWYNTEHHHSGLGLLTPTDVHYSLAEQRVAARAAVLATATRSASRRAFLTRRRILAKSGSIPPCAPYPRGRHWPRRLLLLTRLRSPSVSSIACA